MPTLKACGGMKWDMSKCLTHCWLHSRYSENPGVVVFPLMDGELHLHTDKLWLQPDSLYVRSS